MNAFTRTLIAAATTVSLFGCDAIPNTADIDPLEHQPKIKAYRTNAFYADGRGLRAPPEDTVSQEKFIADPLIRFGTSDGGLGGAIATSPIPVDKGLVTLGKAKYEQVCAVCHGLLGDGNSIVAKKMSLRPPPNITTDVYRARSDGNIYMTIANGYGYMNHYRDQLDVRERWAVVSYVRALQISQNVAAAQLSADETAKLNAPAHTETPHGGHEGGHHE